MEFRISNTFTDSLGHLTGAEQKAAKTTAFDLQLAPTAPGMQFHRLDRTKDPNFWSVRVNSDIRLIVHRTPNSLLLCYVNHHDAAYGWAERRKIERHPVTGAAQLVEVRERVEEIAISAPPPITTIRVAKPPLFADMPEGVLLQYGVPREWLSDAARRPRTRCLPSPTICHRKRPRLCSASPLATPRRGLPSPLSGDRQASTGWGTRYNNPLSKTRS